MLSACTLSRSCPRADSMMIGEYENSRTSSQTAKPSLPGIMMSRMMTSGSRFAASSTACVPSSAEITWYPASSSSDLSRRTRPASSSATSTVTLFSIATILRSLEARAACGKLHHEVERQPQHRRCDDRPQAVGANVLVENRAADHSGAAIHGESGGKPKIDVAEDDVSDRSRCSRENGVRLTDRDRGRRRCPQHQHHRHEDRRTADPRQPGSDPGDDTAPQQRRRAERAPSKRLVTIRGSSAKRGNAGEHEKKREARRYDARRKHDAELCARQTAYDASRARKECGAPIDGTVPSINGGRDDGARGKRHERRSDSRLERDSEPHQQRDQKHAADAHDADRDADGSRPGENRQHLSRCRSRSRQREINGRSFLLVGVEPNAAAVRVHDTARDIQAQSAAVALTVAAAIEALENACPLLGWNTAAAIMHGENDRISIHSQADPDSRILARIANGVAQQVVENLLDSLAVDADHGTAHVAAERQGPFGHRLPPPGDDRAQQHGGIDVVNVELENPLIQFRDIRELSDELVQTQALEIDRLEIFFAERRAARLGSIQERRRIPSDERKGSAKLVRHQRDDLALHLVDVLFEGHVAAEITASQARSVRIEHRESREPHGNCRRPR